MKSVSWFVHCFVVIVPRLVNLDADDWRRGLHRRLHREDDAGNDRGGVSFHPFPQAAAENPTDGQQCQPDKHQVEINAVVFNQAVQRVENGIRAIQRDSSSWFVLRFQFVSLTPKSQPWRLPASPARFSKAAIFRMPPAQIPGLQAR